MTKPAIFHFRSDPKGLFLNNLAMQKRPTIMPRSDELSRPWRRRIAKALIGLHLIQLSAGLPTYAQTVVPNSSAPAGQRPMMDAANNGVPIVLIAPPSAAGVSRNQYQQFNVDKKGLILNNSRGNAQTQLGGWVAGNPQLGATPARVILNEVVSGNRSHLRGTIEVAGKKAAIVVANPNGISCDGCGFLNTDRASLVAGTPQFGAGGALNGFSVGEGQLQVGAQGLNAANIEQLDLIARGLVIDGEIWAKNLNILAGQNQVLYGSLQAIAQNGDGGKPAFAIDIKDLGGMYANQIYMVATEQGLGVNSTGRIAALQGNLELSSSGDLSLKDSYAKQNVNIAANGNIALQSQTISDGNVNVAALGNLQIAGSVHSGGDLEINAAQVADDKSKLMAVRDLSINAQSISLNETTIAADGNATLTASIGNVDADKVQLYAGQDLTVAAANAVANAGGKWQAARDASVSAQRIDNRDASLLANQTLTLETASNGWLDNRGGTLIGNAGLTVDGGEVRNALGTMATDGRLQIKTNGTQLDNTEGQIVGGAALTIVSGSLVNDKGTIAAASGAVNIDTLDNALSNQEESIQANADALIKSNTFDNRIGQVVAGGKLDVTSAELKNRSGLLQADGDLSIDTQGAALDNSLSGSEGGIVSGGTLAVSVGDLDNRSGYIASQSDQHFILAGALDNRADSERADQAGRILGNGKHTTTASTLLNEGGSIQSMDGISVTASETIDNRGGQLASNGDVRLAASQLHNTKINATAGSIDGRDIELAADVVNNAAGKIRSSKAMTVSADSLDNTDGAIAAVDNLTLTINGDYVNSGTLSSEKDLNVTAANIRNAGKMIAGEALSAHAGNLQNEGEISASETALNVSGSLTNTAAGLIDGVTISVAANAVDNTGRLYGDTLQVQADTFDNTQSGTVAARQSLLLGARNISNTDGGLIYSLGDIAIAGGFDNDGNALAASENLLNASAKIEAVGDIDIAVKNLTNRNDGLVTRTETSSTAINKKQIQRYESSDLTKYDPSTLGWSSQLGRGKGAYVRPSGQYPFAIYGSELKKAAYTKRCSERTGKCTYTYHYPNSHPIWALFGVEPGQNRTQAGLLNVKINAFNDNLEARAFDDWYEYTWTKNDVTETVVESTRPAEILAGGALTIAATGSVLNDNSSMVAGGAISVVGATVENRGTQGTKTETQSGRLRIRYVTRTTNDPELKWYDQGSVTGAPIVTTTTLQAYTYKQNASASAASRDLTSGASSASGLVPAAPQVTTTNLPTAGGAVDAALPAEAAAQLSGQTQYRNWTVPNSSLFTVMTAPGAAYLVETDPRFTNQRNFLSSDYYLQKLNTNPEHQLKRYGDGFVEQQLVNDQILALTGKRYLSGYTSTEAEYKGLMDAGIAFAQQYQISPGVSLSAEQMALLTTDIVLLTTQRVTLADGSVQEVLVPQVYLRRPQQGDLLPSGGLMAGSDVYIKSAGDLVNSGQISAINETTLLAGNDLVNRDGRITGNNVYARAVNDLKNISGTIQGTGGNSQVALSAGRDIILETRTIAGQTKRTATTIASQRVNVDRIATVQGGDVTLDAGRDMIGKASVVSADQDLVVVAGRDIKASALENSYAVNDQRGGKGAKGRSAYRKEESVTNELAVFGAGNDIVLTAGTAGQGGVALKGVDVVAGKSIAVQGSDVSIEAVKDSQSADIQTVSRSRYLRNMKADERLSGGTISAGENIAIHAVGAAATTQPVAGTGNVRLTGATLQTQSGQVSVTATNDVEIGAVTTDHSKAYEYYKKSKSTFSTTVVTKANFSEHEVAQGSVISGNTVAIQAGNQIAQTGDVTIKASQVAADNGLQINAGRNLSIGAEQQDAKTYSFYQKKKSGMFSGGSFGVTFGSQKLDQKGWTTSDTNAGSMVGSIDGDVALSAGRHYTQTASQVSAPGGDIAIYAQQVDINAATDIHTASSQHRFKQSGLTIALTGPVISAIQTVQQMSQAAEDTKDGRMQTLAAATAAMSAKHAYDAAQKGQGTSVNGKDANGNTTSRDATAADQAGGINLSISIGSSSSQSKTVQSGTQAVGASIAAGDDVHIVASGGGQHSTVTVQGSDIRAGNNVVIGAENEINLLAAQSTFEQHSTNKSSSGSIGISFGTDGFGVTLSASAGRGKADGTDVVWSNTHVEAGHAVAMASKGDTSVRGAVVRGEQVVADIGGDLHIESVQDTSRYDSAQKEIGGSITIGVGASGSLSYSQSRVNSDYASVVEQSGIKAGDGGFQVNVNGNTDLNGAVIASTEQAVQDGKNRFVTANLSLSDIHNKAEYKGTSTGVTLGVGSQAGVPNLTGAGLGSEKDRTSGITQSGISGFAGNRNVRTDDVQTGIARIFDAEKVQREISAQVQITQAFSQQANKTVADHVQAQRAALRERLDSTRKEDEKAVIRKELDDLLMQERALNILIGAVTGTGSAALSKEALSVAAEEMRRLTIESSLKFDGVVDSEGNTLTNLLKGKSEGLRGDSIGTGGTRVDLDLLCGRTNERCARQQDANGKDILDQDGIPKLALNEKGQVIFNAKNDDGFPLSLDYFIAHTPEGKKMVGATGGIQGYQGTLFGNPYEAGSWQDELIEAFGGTHDYIGGQLSGLYDEQGNATRGRSEALIKVHNAWSATGAIAASAPFAMAELLPSEVWQAISILLRNAK